MCEEGRLNVLLVVAIESESSFLVSLFTSLSSFLVFFGLRIWEINSRGIECRSLRSPENVPGVNSLVKLNCKSVASRNV